MTQKCEWMVPLCWTEMVTPTMDSKPIQPRNPLIITNSIGTINI